ncbi:MAG: transposase [Albidovulum sp.]|nr:transposase [Albidovulum sp.]
MECAGGSDRWHRHHSHFTGAPIHDCRASYFARENCKNGLCGANLLREPTFIFVSSDYQGARLMKKLLFEARHWVSKGKSRILGGVEYLPIRRRYRTILSQGDGERPEIPKRKKGQRGRIAKYDAHKLHARLEKHEDAVLRFLHDLYVSFTNSAGERGLRMAKAKIKVSGCFRTLVYAEDRCQISSYLQSMAAIRSSPSESRLQDESPTWSNKHRPPISIVNVRVVATPVILSD